MNFEFYDKHLKTFPAPQPFLDHEDTPFMGALPDLLNLTRRTTGLDIHFIRAGGSLPRCQEAFPSFPVSNRFGKTAGHLVVYGINEVTQPPTDRDMESFTSSLAELLGEAFQWQWAYRNQRAEQATNLAISERVRKEEEVAEVLRSQLKHTAKIVHAAAAILYILSDDSKHLEARVLWGLPEEKLLEAPRSLRSSLADMEALLGQAVVLNEEYLLESWNPPEFFPSAVCVPILSEANTYGTLWFFYEQERDFETRELSILEIAAGRIAAEIEKAALTKALRNLRNMKD